MLTDWLNEEFVNEKVNSNFGTNAKLQMGQITWCDYLW